MEDRAEKNARSIQLLPGAARSEVTDSFWEVSKSVFFTTGFLSPGCCEWWAEGSSVDELSSQELEDRLKNHKLSRHFMFVYKSGPS